MIKQRLCVHCADCEREEPATTRISYPDDAGAWVSEEVCEDHAEILLEDYPGAHQFDLTWQTE